MKQVRGTVNFVELVGWLGADPELRFTPSGAAVCSFRLATKRVGAMNGDGKREYETEWLQIESWDRLAERCGTMLHKGSRVRVTGSLRTDSWNDRETGQPRYKTFVRADDVLLLDARPDQVDTAEAAEEVTEDIPF